MLMVAAGGLLGAILGSFIATLAVRWPEGRSVIQGRSACDGCGAALSPMRLVPIVSYVARRGRAACCGAPIDRLHPLTEVMAAMIGALSFAAAADPIQALTGAIFGWLLLAMALLDARHFWLPNRLTIALALAGVAAAAAGMPPGPADRLIGGAAAFLLFAGIRYGYRLLRHRDGMGGGDVKLFGAIGLWLGWRMLPIVLLGAALAGLLWSLIQLARGKRLTGASSVPFGSCLAVAAWGGWLAATVVVW
ncbi:prepilin peptidase [Sphingomonas sp. SRS2]|uniref:prepilin peptidase n=1 Tax=Sphingomonas sp. SRS2 TaxID=133190 RepID=UPI0006184EC0|nr:A24 family peptidase [Sphingomonas sp. SRS2]KKC24230.1 peptidase A24 [Sphingomonas sp. SRS2]